MTRYLRYLRVGWTVFCATAAVLLILLWVRSYWRVDQMYGYTSSTKLLYFGSMRGQVTFRRTTMYRGEGIPHNWMPVSEAVSNMVEYYQRHSPTGDDSFLAYQFGSRFPFGRLPDGLYAPHWLLVLTTAVFAAAPWLHKLPRRFSLRILLIATTLIAVLLGLVVWSTR